MFIGCCNRINGVTPPQNGGCSEWIAYHKQLVPQFGKIKANEIFLFWWNKQSEWGSNKNWCKYNNEFNNYFSSVGIDVGNIFSDVVNAGTNIVDGASSGIAILAKLLKIAIPVAVIYVGGKYLKAW
jgi:hypothetical protein